MENYDTCKLNTAKSQQELTAGYASDQVESLELCEGCERMKKNFHLAPNTNTENMIDLEQFDYEALLEAPTKFREGEIRGL